MRGPLSVSEHAIKRFQERWWLLYDESLSEDDAVSKIREILSTAEQLVPKTVSKHSYKNSVEYWNNGWVFPVVNSPQGLLVVTAKFRNESFHELFPNFSFKTRKTSTAIYLVKQEDKGIKQLRWGSMDTTAVFDFENSVSFNQLREALYSFGFSVSPQSRWQEMQEGGLMVVPVYPPEMPVTRRKMFSRILRQTTDEIAIVSTANRSSRKDIKVAIISNLDGQYYILRDFLERLLRDKIY